MPTAPAIHSRKAPGRVHGRIDRQVTRTYHTGSKMWGRIRNRILVRDHYTCQTCDRFGNEVDHIDGDSSNNPDDGSNYQTLCKPCHSRKTAAETLNK
jgi:5-methylcytosine-specific restriction endonuclease McrA